MLVQLHIQNYAIIEELQLDLGPNLNIITGETGAGKSILTGALGLIQGKRADTKILYDKDKKCIVEAVYRHTDDRISRFLKDEEIEEDEELVIRRMITSAGKSKAYVNDEPVKLSTLKLLNEFLIDLHRQFDTLGINSQQVQTSMLDAICMHDDVLMRYHDEFSLYKKNKSSLEKLKKEEHSIKQELEFLQFQMAELYELDFKSGEQLSLEEELLLLESAESIISVLNETNYVIYDRNESITSEIDKITSGFLNIKGLSQELTNLLERLQSVREELIDVAQTADQLSGNFDANPGEIEVKQERLNALYRLLRKHNREDLDELLLFQQETDDKIDELMNFSQDQSKLEKALEKNIQQLKKIANRISTTRKKFAPEFAEKVWQLLAQLGMEHAIFEIDIQASKDFTVSGSDEIQFLFSANPGKAAEPIGQVASGGELSRLALSLKTIVADNFNLPTLIFDEIDSGVSGEVARKMGLILSDLSKNHQVISITHSPQIAAKANRHYFVYKELENQRTYTKIKELDSDEKIVEIAKMLSGDPPPKTALENAKALINS